MSADVETLIFLRLAAGIEDSVANPVCLGSKAYVFGLVAHTFVVYT